MATGSRNDAPPMIVVLTNSLNVSFQPCKVIEAEMEQSRSFSLSSVGALKGAWKRDFGKWDRALKIRHWRSGLRRPERARPLLLVTPKTAAEGEALEDSAACRGWKYHCRHPSVHRDR
jgi:hypothetical protein